MRISIYSLLIILLCSCSTNQDLEGSWLLAYELNEGQQRLFPNNQVFYGQNLLTFKNDVVHKKTFPFSMIWKSGEWVKQDITKVQHLTTRFIREKNQIVFQVGPLELDTLNILEISEDSLILKEQNQSRRSIFKRVNTSTEHQKIELVNKIFQLRTKEIVLDTVHFKENAQAQSIGLPKFSPPIRHPDYPWNVFTHENAQFLILDNGKAPPFVFQEQRGDTLVFEIKHQPNFSVFAIPLKR